MLTLSLPANLTGALFALAIAIAAPSSGTAQTTTQARQQVLADIAAFAAQVCPDVPDSSKKTEKKATGTVNFDLSGLLKRALNAGAAGAASTTKTQGVLQEQLAEVVKTNRNCRLEISKELIGKLFPSSPAPAKPAGKRDGKAPATTGKTADVPPKLFCADVPGSPYNIVALTAKSDCDGCNPQTDTRVGWVTTPAEARSHWTATQKDWLDANARATASVQCVTANPGYSLAFSASHASLAGWGGRPGNYRFSESSVVGIARTGFEVTSSGKYCLLVASATETEMRRKGYTGSKYFKDESLTPSILLIRAPSGPAIAAKAGQLIPLREVGVWSVDLASNSSHRSEWAESSGSIDIDGKFILRFIHVANPACD